MIAFVRRSHIAMLHDTLMAAVSFVLALYLRLGDTLFAHYPFLFEATLVFTLICFGVFTFIIPLYRGMWRYASVPDMVAILKAVSLAILVFLPLMFLITRLDGLPRSAMIINWLVLVVLLGAPRLAYRYLKDGRLSLDFRKARLLKRIPVLVVGANHNAELFLRYLSRTPEADYEVVGMVDDDKNTHGRAIHNVAVAGSVAELPQIVKKLKLLGRAPQRLLLTEDHPEGDRVRRLMEQAEKLGLTVAKLPKLSDFHSETGQQRVEPKPIAIEDLLGRAPKAPNLGIRQKLIAGKHILVTGAGGTIGGELVRQIASYEPASLTLFELSEYALYAIDRELKENHPNLPRRAVLGDVRNAEGVHALLENVQPDIVFHAAALKHVPLVEENPLEGICTNVLGTQVVADACVAHGVTKMVLISTDKAVYPSSIMGATKRLAERYVQSFAAAGEHRTSFSVVRFGNVLGSSGSVVPLFQHQIAKGGPITVTHPEMTRYFMTVPEAVELVLLASTLEPEGKKGIGHVCVLEMGEPVRIRDLAYQMIKLAGLRPEEDIKVTYTGIRQGEKLHEVLFYPFEARQPTPLEGVVYAHSEALPTKKLQKELLALAKACAKQDSAAALALLWKLAPGEEKKDTLLLEREAS